MEKPYGGLLLSDTGNNVTWAHAGRTLGHENKEMTITTTPCVQYNVVQASVLHLDVQKMLPQISTTLPK
jgi:hypothetical protein